MSILIIDNNDSFTYNLVQLIVECGVHDFEVIKTSDLDVETVKTFSKILISPGPGLPKDFPAITQVLERYHRQIPMLGICLGHQAIAEFFGAQLLNVPKPYHGVKSKIHLTENSSYIFNNIPDSFDAGRYHSWVVCEHNFPENLQITAVSDDGFIMAISHRLFDIHGIQFHPESIMTPVGLQIMRNWLKNNPN